MTAPAASTFFRELGRAIESTWRARNHNEAVFPDIATEVLTARPPCEHVRWLDVVNEIFVPIEDACGFPPQRQEPFGQPPVLLYAGDRFYLQMLCWVDATTSIHQHSFSGAFHVLAGSSIHSRFRFHEKKRINSSMRVGDIALDDVELLTVGQTRAIKSGSDLIHALFHLEQPSVTIVARTGQESDRLPQFDYYRPHIAEDTVTTDPRLAKQRELLVTLGRVDPERLVKVVTDFLPTADFQATWHALAAVHAFHSDAAPIPALLDIARGVHGRLVDLLPDVLDERRWRENLIGHRRAVTDPDLRFLLALLLNIPDRTRLLSVASSYCGGEARTRLVEWLRRLVTVRDDGSIEVLNAVIPPLLPGLPTRLAAEPLMALLEGLLEGRTVDGVKKRLTHDYTAEQVSAGAARIDGVARHLARTPLRAFVQA